MEKENSNKKVTKKAVTSQRKKLNSRETKDKKDKICRIWQLYREKIENAIDEKTKMPEEEKNKIYKKIFENTVIANVIILFLYLIGIGSINIDARTFITDLRVFSIGLIIFTILLFEISYRKENTNLCIHGIEVFVLSLLTLFSIYAYVIYNNKFQILVAIVSYIFALYYVIKSTIIYLKMRKNYYKSLSDINQIVKTRRKK